MKNCRRIGLTFLAFLLAVSAEQVHAQVGGSAVPFLVISPDSRASGMGEVGTAIADDINAIYWNPAGLGFHDYTMEEGELTDIPYTEVSLAYSKWLPQFQADLFYCYLAGGRYIESLDGTVAANFIFFNLGEFTRTDANGKELGKFISNEFTFGLSYGTMIAKDLAIGFQLKYIRSNLAPISSMQQGAGTGSSGAFDLGLLWKPRHLNVFGWELDDVLSLGFNLQNVGPKVTYREESDPLPTTLRLGTAFNLYKDEFNDLKVGFDFSKLLVRRETVYEGEDSVAVTTSDPVPLSLFTGWKNSGAELAFGIEYWYSQVFALRAGYFTEPAKAGNRKYWNFGAGIRYDIFRLDFSFINPTESNHPLANTMRFTASVNFN